MHVSAGGSACHGRLGNKMVSSFCAKQSHIGVGQRASNESFGVLPSESTIHLDFYSKIDSAEVTEGLQRILGKVFSREELCDYTSHSLKSTLLPRKAWMRLHVQ